MFVGLHTVWKDVCKVTNPSSRNIRAKRFKVISCFLRFFVLYRGIIHAGVKEYGFAFDSGRTVLFRLFLLIGAGVASIGAGAVTGVDGDAVDIFIEHRE